MVRYCPGCGRSIPLDARLCPYCSKAVPSHGITAIPVEKKSNVGKIILIVAVVIIVLILITVAIAATVYVYVTGMVPETSSSTENAAVTISENNDLIQVTLVSVGQNYNSGYSNFVIYVDGSFVEGLENIGYWTVGEPIMIGSDSAGGYIVSGLSLSTGEYDVSVAILDTVVYMGSVRIV